MSKIIVLEGTFNTRDIAGIVNTEGKTIKPHRMIRSDALNTLTSNDVSVLQNIGLKTIVDFRADYEIKKSPDVKIEGVVTINLSPNAELAALASGNIVNDQEKIDKLEEQAKTAEGRALLQSKMDEMVDQMRELVNAPYAIAAYKGYLNLISDENNLPLLHHCMGGKDRTGFATIITLLTLDVDLNDIKKEYMMTKECMAERNVRRMNQYRAYTDNPIVLDYLSGLMSTKEIYFDAAIEEMIKLSGSPANYLTDYLGMTPEKKEKIKHLFLEN